MLSSLRFRWSKYAGQNRRRITSQEALSTLIKDSVFLKDLEKAEEIANTVQGAAVGLKRRADVI